MPGSEPLVAAQPRHFSDTAEEVAMPTAEKCRGHPSSLSSLFSLVPLLRHVELQPRDALGALVHDEERPGPGNVDHQGAEPG